MPDLRLIRDPDLIYTLRASVDAKAQGNAMPGPQRTSERYGNLKLLTFRNTPEQMERYRSVAKRRGIPLSALVRELLEAEEMRLDELDVKKKKLRAQRDSDPPPSRQRELDEVIHDKSSAGGMDR